MTIEELQREAHETACVKGWWDNPREILSQLMLMVTELAEAAEECRVTEDIASWCAINGKPEGFPIELADCIIRIADTAQRYGIDLTEALRVKMDFNKTRPHRHGGKLA